MLNNLFYWVEVEIMNAQEDVQTSPYHDELHRGKVGPSRPV